MVQNSQIPSSDTGLRINPLEYEERGDNATRTVTNAPFDGHLFPDLSKTRAVLLVAVLSMAALLTVLNSQSIVIILPELGESLNIPSSRQQLVVSIYNISTGSLMLLWGRLADVYGRRLGFLSGCVIFTLSTLCLPWSSYEMPFYVLRAVQGMAAGAIMPSGIGTMASTFAPGPSRNLAYITMSAMASLGSVLGSLLGGFVGSTLGWKWVFWIPAVAAAATTVSGFAVTAGASMRAATQGQSVRQGGGKRPYVDWIGGVLVSCSLTLLLVVMTQANVIGWSTPWIPPLMVVSVLLLGAFIFYQRRLEGDPDRLPLMRMSMFRKKQFSALFCAGWLLLCVFQWFPGVCYLLDYLGLDELQAALQFLPAGISGLLVSFAVFPALKHLPSFTVLFFGLLCNILPPFLFALPSIPPSTIYWAWGFPAMCLCMSVEIVWPVFSLLTAKSLPQEDQSLGGGLLQTVNNVGRALGLAVATAVQTAVTGDSDNGKGSEANLQGLRAAQWVNFALAAAAILVTLTFFRGLGKA
ncbi:hypothetical protein NM208_g6667 [Fusarium decemcellulare]|uniref:Uncharacterized protein n=1 Tax=Fusarium decemcellulare TaxID=57161 RepID=A0ACC1SCF4_9HYPO|nr:hypothetical protein NM208_g6667 [Fusarium decemcellulare]